MKWILSLLLLFVFIDKYTAASLGDPPCPLMDQPIHPISNSGSGTFEHVVINEIISLEDGTTLNQWTIDDYRRITCPAGQVISDIKDITFGYVRQHWRDKDAKTKKCRWGCTMGFCKHTTPKLQSYNLADSPGLNNCLSRPYCDVRAHPDFVGHDPAKGCIKTLSFKYQCAPLPEPYHVKTVVDHPPNEYFHITCPGGKKIRFDDATKVLTTYGTGIACNGWCPFFMYQQYPGGYMDQWVLSYHIELNCNGRDECHMIMDECSMAFNYLPTIFGWWTALDCPTYCPGRQLTVAWKCED